MDYPQHLEEPPDAFSSEPSWGLGDVLAALVLGVAISAVVDVIWLLASGTPLSAAQSLETATLSTWFLIANELGLWLGFGGVPLFASRVKGYGSLAKDFGLRMRPWPDIPLGIVLGVAAQFAIDALYVPIVQLFPSLRSSLSQPTQELFGGRGDRGYLLVTVLVALGAPLFEELLFRGLLLRSLQKRFRTGPWALTHLVPTVGSAVVFALMHFEPAQLLGLFLVGVLLAELATRTNRLGPGIATHAGFNLAAVAATYLAVHH